jgi:transcription termination factor NusB
MEMLKRRAKKSVIRALFQVEFDSKPTRDKALQKILKIVVQPYSISQYPYISSLWHCGYWYRSMG